MSQQQQAGAERHENDEAIPPLPDDWTRCHVYMRQKRRYCRQHALPDSYYCGNHQEYNTEQQQWQKGEPDAPASHVRRGTRTATSNTGEHEASSTPTSSDNNDCYSRRPRRRITCPLDPSHTVAVDRLDQHVKKCPAAKRQSNMEQASYYCRRCNTGGYGAMNPEETTKKNSLSDIGEQSMQEWAQRIALAVLQIHQSTICGAASNNDNNDVTKVTLQCIEESLELQDLAQQELECGLEQAIDTHRIKSGGPKHVHQQASLVGHLRRLGVLPDIRRPSHELRGNSKGPEVDATTVPRETKKARTTPVVIFDMGAGRGMLGLIASGVSAVTQPTNLVLVERGGSRSKADTVLRSLRKKKELATESLKDDPQHSKESCASQYMNLYDLQWSRLTCDLADVKMARVLQEQEVSEKFHVIAKHLCGVGTDLALKALEPVKEHVSTCLLATCCHGVCNWQDYVGRDFLRELFAAYNVSFGRAEFELLRRWSAGSVLSNGEDKSAGEAHGHPLSLQTRNEDNDARSPVAIGRVVDALGLACGARGLGRCCQRLIDFCRREYIQQVLFSNHNDAMTSLVHYVESDVTPQNAIILGRKDRAKS